MIFQKRREALIQRLADIEDIRNSLVLLNGNQNHFQHDTSQEECPFKGDDTFKYFYGLNNKHYFGCIHLGLEQTYLVQNKIVLEEAGDYEQLDPNMMKEKFKVDKIFTRKEFKEYLNSIEIAKIYIYKGVNKESGQTSNFVDEKFLLDKEVDKSLLYIIVNKLRSILNEEEIKIFQAAQKKFNETIEKQIQEFTFKMKPFQIVNKINRELLSQDFEVLFDSAILTGQDCRYLNSQESSQDFQLNDFMIWTIRASYQGINLVKSVTLSVNDKITKEQKEILDCFENLLQKLKDLIKTKKVYEKIEMDFQQLYLQTLKELKLINTTNADLYRLLNPLKIIQYHSSSIQIYKDKNFESNSLLTLSLGLRIDPSLENPEMNWEKLKSLNLCGLKLMDQIIV